MQYELWQASGTGKSMEFLHAIVAHIRGLIGTVPIGSSRTFTGESLEAAHHGMISRTARIISVEMKPPGYAPMIYIFIVKYIL